MSSANATQLDAHLGHKQGKASSSEVAAPTLQSRRGFGGNKRADIPRASTTASSSQTVVENAGTRKVNGLIHLGEIMVQNKSMRIISNHTAETMASLAFLSSQISKTGARIGDLGEDDPRALKLGFKEVRLLDLYHSLARGLNDTLSRPRASDRDTKKLHDLASEHLDSSSLKGEDGAWLKTTDLADYSRLTGSMQPFEVWAHGLVESKARIFGVAAEKSDIDGANKYKWWLDPWVEFLAHVLFRSLMLATMIMPVAATKLWGPSPVQQTLMHAASILFAHMTTLGVARDLGSQMLLTVTVASLSAEILSGTSTA